MGISITHSTSGYQFENRENQKNTAKQILEKSENREEAVESIMDKTTFNSSDGMIYSNAQLSVIKASSHINVNDSLKETLKYLKNHTVNNVKKQYILGELWEIVSKKNGEYNAVEEIEIDFSIKNIFAA